MVAIAVFVAAIVVVALDRPSDRTQTAATEGPSVAPDDTPPIGVGLAPEGAAPSSPTRGELVFSFLFGHTMGDPGRFSVHVYADGRLIWQRLADIAGTDPFAPSTATGLVEQRLTPEGVDLLMSEVRSTGLVDDDHRFESAEGLYFGQMDVRDGDRRVRVTWGDCCKPGSEDEPRAIPTPAQVSALQGLDARLEDPASWLPANVWEDPEISAYVPSGYSVCFEAEQGIGLSRVLAALPRPAEDMLRSLGRRRSELPQRYPELSLDIWCSHVTTEEARALAQLLDDAGEEGHESIFGLRYVVGQPGGTVVSVSFGPLLPHQV